MNIKLDSPGASKCPFLFKRGDKVRSKLQGDCTGVIEEGECGCAEEQFGPYKIMYYVRNSDGLCWKTDQKDIEIISEN